MDFPSFVQENFIALQLLFCFCFLFLGLTSPWECTINSGHYNITPREGFSVGCLSELRPNSWTNFRKSEEFSSLLFKVTFTALPSDFYFFKLKQPLTVSTVH
jgi:hypothetical protein